MSAAKRITVATRGAKFKQLRQDRVNAVTYFAPAGAGAVQRASLDSVPLYVARLVGGIADCRLARRALAAVSGACPVLAVRFLHAGSDDLRFWHRRRRTLSGLGLAGGLCAVFAILFLDFQVGDLWFWRRRTFSGLDLAGGLRAAFAILFLDFRAGDLRFWYRQRHVLAGRDHVEFARKQHREATRVANAPGDAAGLLAGTQVEVGA